MSEQLQKELAAWLSQLREAAQHGASFALDQAPLIVQEKILYGRVTESMLLLAFLAGVGLFIYAALLTARWHRESPYDDWFIGTGFSVAAVGFFSIASVIQSFEVAKVWLAPRLYIVEWLASLLK